MPGARSIYKHDMPNDVNATDSIGLIDIIPPHPRDLETVLLVMSTRLCSSGCTLLYQVDSVLAGNCQNGSMYCQNICVVLGPLLHKNCAKLELLIWCYGLGISCHSIINNWHNFAIIVNMCTLTENSALSKLTFSSSI